MLHRETLEKLDQISHWPMISQFVRLMFCQNELQANFTSIFFYPAHFSYGIHPEEVSG